MNDEVYLESAAPPIFALDLSGKTQCDLMDSLERKLAHNVQVKEVMKRKEWNQFVVILHILP